MGNIAKRYTVVFDKKGTVTWNKPDQGYPVNAPMSQWPYGMTLFFGSSPVGMDPGPADFDTLEDNAVTVRDRDTMEQVRVPIDGLLALLSERLPT